VPYGLLRAVGVAGCVVLCLIATPARAVRMAPAMKTGPGRPPLPEVLVTTESSAEDIVDFALSRDRGNVVSTAARLRTFANGPAAAALIHSGVRPPKVAQLEQRANRVLQLARRGSFIDIALAANAVSQLMPELYAHFRDRVPSSILALDYFDREAHLRSLARQPVKVASAVAGLERTWPRVRPKVVAAGGATEAAAYDRHIRLMKHLEPGASRSVQAEAVRGLELVDDLERVFTG
jgi:hypothetical protein